jgi:hypothetical protein
MVSAALSWAKEGEGCSRTPAEMSLTSAALYTLYAADQADRSAKNPETAKNDADRRAEVHRFDKAGEICSGLDHYHAAVILLHGDDAADAARAYELAVESMNRRVPQGPWAVANTFDRWRVSRGLAQSYGTATAVVKGKLCIYPVDPAFSDAMRAQYGMDPIASAYRRVLDAVGDTNAQPTWREIEKAGLACKLEAWK